MIIQKTLRNAAVGTVAAGAMILPTATTIAPQLQLVAGCSYPDSRFTDTEQELSRYVIRKGAVTSTVTVDSLAGNDAPNGTITVSVYRPNGGLYKSKSKTITGSEDTAKFRFGGFRRAKQARTWEFVATFNGFCRYTDSSDNDFLFVDGRR